MKQQWTQVILGELTSAMAQIDEGQLDALTEELIKPGRRVFCVGVGRVLLSMKTWVKRMYHLEIDINYVGSETEPALREGDLLLLASGSGESVFPVKIGEKAKGYGATIAYIGCTPGSSAERLSDLQVILPGRTKNSGDGGFATIQPMSTLFEQQLFLLGDALALEIMERRGLKEADVRAHHANLE